MCGIVGYIGCSKATPILISGLRHLEYRGYDSAGIALHDKDKINIYKTKGNIDNLDKLLNDHKLDSTIGIGHTRWSTHGKPSDLNSHPHFSESGRFAIVHNGIIENYLDIKDFLSNKGINFKSETDSEVIANLIDYFYEGDFFSAVTNALEKLHGSYALAILCNDDKDKIIVAKKDSPLVLGINEKEKYIASDIGAILRYTRNIIKLNDNEIAVVENDNTRIYDKEKNLLKRHASFIDWDINEAQKDGFDHFMLKEIYEQPHVIKETIESKIKDGNIVLDNFEITKEELNSLSKICIVACGSAYNIGCIAKYVIEDLTRIPVEVDLASEFRYRNPILDNNVLVIAISQSGETADTLAALKKAKSCGAKTLSIVNVIGSSIEDNSDNVIYTKAGPEIAVATTKAYSTQLIVIYLIAIYMSKKLSLISEDTYKNYINELYLIPDKIKNILQQKDKIKDLSDKYYKLNNIFFIGRNIDYPSCLEGSLKLKEISYINSQAYASGELKHGTISLIEDNTLVICLSTQDYLFEKSLSNIKEVKAREAGVFVLTTREHNELSKICDDIVYIPDSIEFMLPSLSVIVLQLFAYFVALKKGCDIDKPRNLAKSVTVE